MTDTTTPPQETQDPTGDVARPDLKAPPSSPEPDREALEKGLDKLEAVKPY